jgi:hypothetical protein
MPQQQDNSSLASRVLSSLSVAKNSLLDSVETFLMVQQHEQQKQNVYLYLKRDEDEKRRS